MFRRSESQQGNLKVRGFDLDASRIHVPKPLQSVFGAVRRCTDFNTANIDADIVHCHTWYSHFGGILAKLNYGFPLVITVHSLEPLRPWKREQLGGGYDFTVWLEKTALEMADAVIAVSERDEGGHRTAFQRPARPAARHLQRDRSRGISERRVERQRSCGRIDPKKPFCSLSDGSRGRRESFISCGRSNHGPGISNRSLRGRAGHAGNRRGNESGGRGRRSETRPM